MDFVTGKCLVLPLCFAQGWSGLLGEGGGQGLLATDTGLEQLFGQHQLQCSPGDRGLLLLCHFPASIAGSTVGRIPNVTTSSCVPVSLDHIYISYLANPTGAACLHWASSAPWISGCD